MLRLDTSCSGFAPDGSEARGAVVFGLDSEWPGGIGVGQKSPSPLT